MDNEQTQINGMNPQMPNQENTVYATNRIAPGMQNMQGAPAGQNWNYPNPPAPPKKKNNTVAIILLIVVVLLLAGLIAFLLLKDNGKDVPTAQPETTKTETTTPATQTADKSATAVETPVAEAATQQEVETKEKVAPAEQKNNTPDFKIGYITDPVDDYVNVRKGPGTDYDIVNELYVGDKIYYTKGSGNWRKVYDLNKRYLGYIYYDRIVK